MVYWVGNKRVNGGDPFVVWIKGEGWEKMIGRETNLKGIMKKRL